MPQNNFKIPQGWEKDPDTGLIQPIWSYGPVLPVSLIDLIQKSDDPDNCEPNETPPNLCGDDLMDDKNAELAPVKTTTKRRGRPKKQLKEAEEEQEPPPEKRRRGRPRKKAGEAEQEPELRRSSRQGRAEISM